jgi:diaminohydroxyphosphoribosylaminopyrimidine deaminase/5-amino-6-(5-phosphoribosylamino)uracil reductase
LNAGFFSRMLRGRPWVRVKAAQSLDGRTALHNGESRWISSEQSRQDVQHWRARSDAILTGIGTVRADKPRLTVREPGVARQPLRVIADSGFSIDANSQILQPPGAALVVGCFPGPDLDRLSTAGVECLAVDGNGQSGGVNLHALLEALAERGINEVQVEAGSTLCGALLASGVVDEILLYQAPLLLGVDAPPAFSIGPLESMAQGVHLEVREIVSIGPDLRIRLFPRANT